MGEGAALLSALMGQVSCGLLTSTLSPGRPRGREEADRCSRRGGRHEPGRRCPPPRDDVRLRGADARQASPGPSGLLGRKLFPDEIVAAAAVVAASLPGAEGLRRNLADQGYDADAILVPVPEKPVEQAMSERGLPEDGELRLGPVMLPAGRRYFAVDGPGDLPGKSLAWVTVSPVPDASRLWWALSDLHAQTGLAPFLVAGPEDNVLDLFSTPFDVAELDHMSAAVVLSGLWADNTPPEFDQEPGWVVAERAPFGRQFPGLAPGGDARLSPAQLAEAVDSLAEATDAPGGVRLGLAVARRPADVLSAAGWQAQDMAYPPTLSIAAVLRSWEERFGARLVQIGPDATIKLLVERPPRTFDTALAVAAEHYVFCDQSQWSPHSVPEIAQALVGAPVWSLWWD
jgi:hypothetical protein